jgi:hypothetical protein
VTGAGGYGVTMRAGNGVLDSQWQELYAQVEATRRRSRVLAARHQAARRTTALLLRRIHAARARAEQVGELWLAAHPGGDRLRYSAAARMQARLESMPVIEQAKGIIMAQYGWPEDQAFDALRRVSQRHNIKVRDLAAQIVARTAGSAPARPRARPARANGAAGEEPAYATILAAAKHTSSGLRVPAGDPGRNRLPAHRQRRERAAGQADQQAVAGAGRRRRAG